MSLEQRGSRFYFYEKRREGHRVISEYRGAGVLAALAARFSGEARQEREQQRQQQRKIRHEQKQIDRQLADVETALASMTHATLVAAGYHQHKGQWRKKRRGK